MQNKISPLTNIKKMSPKDFIEKKKKEFIKFSKLKEKNSQKFLEKHLLYLYQENKFLELTFDIKKKFRLDYLYYKSVADYISKKATDDGLVPIFVTLTLPSEYHFLKQSKKGKFLFNKKYQGYTIQKGYELLRFVTREILRNYKRYNGRTGYNIQYIRVFEYHKDFTSHCHFVAWVPDFLQEQFVELVKTKRKRYGLGKEYKIEVLKDQSKGSAYLLKYLQKTLLDENEENLYILDGWRKANKIRIFTHSRTYLQRKDFVKILQHYKENVEQLTEDEWVNRYAEIAERTKYIIVRGKSKTEKEIVDIIKRDNGGKKYYVNKDIVTLEQEIPYTALFNKRVKNKKFEFYQKLRKIESYNVSADKKVEMLFIESKSFLTEYMKQVKLLYDLFKRNKTLQQTLGKALIRGAFRNYTKKLSALSNVLTKKINILEQEYNSIKTKELRNSGEFNFHNKQDVARFKEFLYHSFTGKKEFFMKAKKKIFSEIKHIVDEMVNSSLYLSKSITITKKHKIFYKNENGEIEKIYDKDYVEFVQVFDPVEKAELLKMGA